MQIIQKMMLKKFTPHCHQCPLEDDRFATCNLLTILVFWKTVKNNCNNSLNGWRKQQQYYGMEIGSDKSKILVESTKTWPSTKIQMNGKVLEEVYLFKYLGSTQTKHGTS